MLKQLSCIVFVEGQITRQTLQLRLADAGRVLLLLLNSSETAGYIFHYVLAVYTPGFYGLRTNFVTNNIY